MNPTLRNILAVIAGLVIGSFVNGAIVKYGGSLVPPPEGADVSTMEGLKASMHLFEPKHFLVPFLAHAIGTFVAAFIAVKLAVSRHLRLAMVIGALFLIGGISAVFMLPSPLWFSALDLIVAYLPMAYLAAKLGIKK